MILMETINLLDSPDILFPIPRVDADQALGVPDGVHLASQKLFSQMKKITLEQS